MNMFRIESTVANIQLEQGHARQNQSVENTVEPIDDNQYEYSIKNITIFVTRTWATPTTPPHTIIVSVKPADTVELLKEKLNERWGIEPDRVRLIFQGRQLVEEQTLLYYGVKHESTLYALLRLCGC